VGKIFFDFFSGYSVIFGVKNFFDFCYPLFVLDILIKFSMLILFNNFINISDNITLYEGTINSMECEGQAINQATTDMQIGKK